MTTPNDNLPPHHDDALLTAYALGELDGDAFAQERAAVEARLADDPALREQVASIASVAQQLETGFERSAEPGLPDATLDSLPHAASAPPAPADSEPRTTNPLARLLPYAAVAACAAGATAIGFIALQGPGNTSPNPADLPDVVASDPLDTPNTQADPPVSHADSPPSHEPTPRERIALALASPTSAHYDAAPLGQVLNDLREQAGVNLMVNWPSLEVTGIGPDTEITLHLDDVPIRTALDATLQIASANSFDDDKAGYRIGEELVEVSTRYELKEKTQMRVYNLRPLITSRAILLAQFEAQLLALFRDEEGDGFAPDDELAVVPDFSSAPSFDLNDALSLSDRGGRDIDRLNERVSRTGQPLFPEPARRGHAAQIQLPADRSGFDGSFDLHSGLGSGGGLFGDDSGDDRPGVPSVEDRLQKLQEMIRQSTGSSISPDDFPTREEQVEAVIELIQDTVGDSDEWLDEDSTIREIAGQLIIKTTAENHDMIDQLLSEFEGAAAPEVGMLALADDPERIADLADLIAHDVEQRLLAVREREARRDQYAELNDNPFLATGLHPLSTFSVDVDTASYAIARRTLLESHQLPGPGTIRIEEFINYFQYDYAAPAVPIDRLDDGLLTSAALERLEAEDASFTPFATHIEVAQCPWAEGHQLVRIGIKGMEVSFEDRPAAHLTFLLDVSGSMNSNDKLPLVKDAMVMLLDQLRDDDRVSIVVYAGATGSVIEGVPASDYERIRDAIDGLQSSGGTNGAAGIELAYELAERYYVPGGVNRVVLCTDGDFNVGTSDTEALVELIEAKANPDAPLGGEPAPAVYLSVFGVGTGNLNDDMMEKLTNAGNGNYGYLDSLDEAARALSDQVNGTLVTIAKDVKLQVEFNPAQVAAYRLIGYENRILQDEDFNDDTVDAGDIGAGHTVTALYEIVPAAGAAPTQEPVAEEAEAETRDVDPLRYQRPSVLTDAAALPELMTVALRYKPVDAAATQGTSRRIAVHVPAQSVPFAEASEPTRFAAAVAALGMTLRGSAHRGSADLSWVIATADAAREHDPHGHRAEFIDVAEQARKLLEPEAVE
ncbi:MAG: von Willebrand factor type A domain-containing protein [Planctomycetota bacterium]